MKASALAQPRFYWVGADISSFVESGCGRLPANASASAATAHSAAGRLRLQVVCDRGPTLRFRRLAPETPSAA